MRETSLILGVSLERKTRSVTIDMLVAVKEWVARAEGRYSGGGAA